MTYTLKEEVAVKASKKSKLQQAQEKLEAAFNQTNIKIEELGSSTKKLYESLTNLQDLFDKIRNIPSDKRLEYKNLEQTRSNWKEQAEKIEEDYNKLTIKSLGAGAVGAGLGLAVVTLGPNAAMGIATTFGVASTGTAISTLSGAAATNAALAWLGGGALLASGGGMAAGQALIALTGPVGWSITGLTLLSSAILFMKNSSDKKDIENIFIAISHRDIKSYELALVEINERIVRIKDESKKLNDSIRMIKTFGLDYNLMTEDQQYVLGSYVNLMLSSTQLLINPIKGLEAKFTNEDFKSYLFLKEPAVDESTCIKYRNFIISLANMLYKIILDDKRKKLLWKSFRNNKDLLDSMGISKEEFNIDFMNTVFEALDFKYKMNNNKQG